MLIVRQANLTESPHGLGVTGLQFSSTLKGHESWLSERAAPFMIHSTTAGALTTYLSRLLSKNSIIAMKLAFSIEPFTIVTTWATTQSPDGILKRKHHWIMRNIDLSFQMLCHRSTTAWNLGQITSPPVRIQFDMAPLAQTSDGKLQKPETLLHSLNLTTEPIT